MAEPSFAKKAATLAWSGGLGVVLILITTVVLLPSTKSASPRLKSNEESTEESGASAPADYQGFSHMPSSKMMIFEVPLGQEEFAEPQFSPQVPDGEEFAELQLQYSAHAPDGEEAGPEIEGPVMYGSKSGVFSDLTIPRASAVTPEETPGGWQRAEPTEEPRELAPAATGQDASSEEGTP